MTLFTPYGLARGAERDDKPPSLDYPRGVAAIQEADMELAAALDDVDAAALHLQTIAGIEDGGIAGACLPDQEQWGRTDLLKRLDVLGQWLNVEKVYEEAGTADPWPAQPTRESIDPDLPANVVVRKVLLGSTAHVSPETRDWLNAEAAKAASWNLPETGGVDWPAIPIMGGVYGWQFYAQEEFSDDLPAEIKALMVYARKVGADWVELDGDSDKIVGLPTWEW